MQVNRQIILATLLYADIFDYPLTLDELWKYQIPYKGKKVSLEEITDFAHSSKEVSFFKNLVSLKERQDLFALRYHREKESKQKMIRAEKIIDVLQNIPTVELIGVSGSLAMGNAKKDDDIDLF